MNQDSTTDCLLFPELFRKSVVVEFDEMNMSSDGGAVLLKAADDRLGLTERVAGALRDRRETTRISHSLRDLVAQRVFAIACGYPDANDADRLASDAVHKLALERDPIEDRDLASQPTVSRFENSANQKELYRMGEALGEAVIERHRKRRYGRARQITIDLDTTEDPTYGDQQLTFFNGFYNNWCYLPLLAFVSFDDEKDQFLVAAVLQPGNAKPKAGAIGILRRLLPRLRRAFPKVRFLVRLDAGFAAPELFDYLESESNVRYVVGFEQNTKLLAIAEPLLERARARSATSDVSEREYGEVSYQTRSWPYERRIIMKAEVTRLPGRAPRDNPRFLVTNLRQSPRYVYEKTYCMRGEIENRVKELQDGLYLGRTSCSRFCANQFRVLLTATAYVLMQELRLRAARTSLARAQVATLRDALLKIAARVAVSVRRIVLHLPRLFPSLHDWHHIARSLGASSG
jgi:hypothetical protein